MNAPPRLLRVMVATLHKPRSPNRHINTQLDVFYNDEIDNEPTRVFWI